jgi:hypothetical protein
VERILVCVSQPVAVDGAPVEVGGLEVDGEEAAEGEGENVMPAVFVVVLVPSGTMSWSSLMR